jgi:hypothetical protein
MRTAAAAHDRAAYMMGVTFPHSLLQPDNTSALVRASTMTRQAD